jgi:hypothetical protein
MGWEINYLDQRICRAGDFIPLLQHDGFEVPDLFIQQLPLLSFFVILVFIFFITFILLVILLIITLTLLIFITKGKI